MNSSYSTALKAHLAGATQTTATGWKVTLPSGEVRGFTDHDQDVEIDGVTYVARTGYLRSDVQSTSGLNVDNLELSGVLSSPSITEDDLRAGVWDYAQVEHFVFNYADLTMGRGIERIGTIGKVSTGRDEFSAELSGMAKAYTRTLGRLVTPGCTANLGDDRCKVDLDSDGLTVTGTIEEVGPDGLTFFDSARTEPGPDDGSGGVQIVAVTVADPGLVTTATPLNVPHGTAILIHGATTTWQINGPTIVRNPSGSTFDLGISTLTFPPYSGGAMDAYVTVLDENSGFFDGGAITFTSGANDGLSMEIKSYAPGQFTLVLPMPYAVEVGDTYTMHAGCNKRLVTCRDRFNNTVNFRGFPYLPGLDQLMQVGRAT